MIGAKTKVLGLLAHPVGHSLSPLLQSTLATVCGRNVACLSFEVRDPEEFGTAVCDAHTLDIARFNVTVPCKEAVIPHFCNLNEEARLIDVVNMLIRTERGYIEHDTSIADIATMLTRGNLRMGGAHILLLDTGGATRSTAVPAATGGATELVILNRNTARAEALAKVMRDISPFPTVRTAVLEHWRELPGNDYLCIQCTSVNIWPSTEETIMEDPRFFEKLSAAVDIVYMPGETKFLWLARTAGEPVAGGLAMLISQDAHTFSPWTGKRCTAERERELLTLAKGAFPA